MLVNTLVSQDARHNAPRSIVRKSTLWRQLSHDGARMTRLNQHSHALGFRTLMNTKQQPSCTRKHSRQPGHYCIITPPSAGESRGFLRHHHREWWIGNVVGKKKKKERNICQERDREKYVSRIRALTELNDRPVSLTRLIQRSFQITEPCVNRQVTKKTSLWQSALQPYIKTYWRKECHFFGGFTNYKETTPPQCKWPRQCNKDCLRLFVSLRGDP